MALPFDSVRAVSSPSPASTDVGGLPQWRLDDLYESMDSPRFAADLERAQREAKRFAEAWRGKLAAIAGAEDAGERLAEAVRAYEALQDLSGRVMSYASLLYASDTSDGARAKFYGDTQERVTALAGDLLFFELELNRIDDARSRRRWRRRRSAITGPGSRTSARRSRISWPTTSSSCSSKSRSPARRRGTGCSMTRWPRCASISRARA